MAVVWRGFDTQLRRTVAVKVLHAHLHLREEIRRRFDREAHAVARLHHPHILEVYDFSGADADPSWLVTEFIDGQTLRALADAHPFDPPELAAACLLPIAEALEHAHAAGVVHRDLKPENVMVREDGLIKLTDFGIAALLDPDEKFTATGAILGSPSHLAPETIEGKPADPRSDLFSFGTIFYWLSCGELPFRAPSPAALLRQILEATPTDPRRIRPSLGDAQAKVIARCLERDPQRRYQSARELKADLAALLAEAGIADAQAEMKAFVSARPPELEAARLRGQLIEGALSRGTLALAQRRTAAALSEFGRALSLQPANEMARSLVARIRRRARLAQLSRRAGLAVVLVAVLWLGGARAARALHDWRLAHRAGAAVVAVRPLAVPAQAPPGAVPPPTSPSAVSPSTAPSPTPPPRPPGSTGRASRPPHPDGAAALPRTAQIAKGTIPVTLKVHYIWGDVTLDGKDIGRGEAFQRPLTPGRHTAIVRHPCCADNTQVFEVVPTRDHYILELGPAKDARLAISNAPADAHVLVDGSFLGTVTDLAAHPIAMGDKPTRDIDITVGDRAGPVRLRAGEENRVDYLDLAKAEGAP